MYCAKVVSMKTWYLRKVTSVRTRSVAVHVHHFQSAVSWHLDFLPERDYVNGFVRVFAIANPSIVCLSVVCNVHALYSAG